MSPPGERSPGTRFTLRQLEYFVAVAEAGTVTAAADRLHLSQSAMSTSLADLERVLGVQLLVRHHARGVTLTASGEALLFSARELLRQADDLKASANALGHSLVGRLRLGCFAILAPYVLPALLAAVEREFPGLEVEPVEEPLDGIQTGLAEGRFELALTYELALSEAIETRPLRQIRPHALLAASHPLSSAESVHLADLADEPFVLLDIPHSRDYFRLAFTDAGVQPHIRYRTRSAETARALVARGLGWSLLNLRPTNNQSVEGRRVVARELADPMPALTLVLAKSRGTRLTKRASVLEELAFRTLSEGSGGKGAAF